jgi:hypothetical protein
MTEFKNKFTKILGSTEVIQTEGNVGLNTMKERKAQRLYSPPTMRR